MQADPLKPKLKLPGTKRLKRKCEGPLSNFALKFKLRRYTTVRTDMEAALNHLVPEAGAYIGPFFVEPLFTWLNLILVGGSNGDGAWRGYGHDP